MKNVLITGAAGGIGSEIVKKFAQNGYRVIIHYNRSGDEASSLFTSLNAKGYAVDTVRFDLNDFEAIKASVLTLCAKYGSIDVLVNNAGIAEQKLFTDLTDDCISNMLNINLTSAMVLTRELLPYMINNKYGKIINISSMWGICGSSCEVHYSAAKAGLIGFTKALAKEVAPSGINVNCVAPGLIDTKMNSSYSKSDLEAFTNEIPLMRIGKTTDIAEAVYFLSSESASYITGIVLPVDGGITI